MNFDWTAEVVGRMHMAAITGKQLADEAGLTNSYLSAVLHNKKGNATTQQRIIDALERLEQRLNAAEAALQSQQLQLETCGSIAEASLKLNGVFEAAQKAAEQYQQNVERLCQEKISAAESQAQEILARAKKAANEQ